MIHAPFFALPFGEGGPQGRVRCGSQLLLSAHFGEILLRTSLIRPCCALRIGAPSPEGKAFQISQNRFKIAKPTLPLFSGWNWQPKMLSFSTAAVMGMP